MKGVVKVYPDGTVALRGVDFDVCRGEVHALLGENGAGKTTLMKILAGMLKPTSGEILLEGRPVSFSSSADALRSGIGMVHQHPALVQTFTAYENIVLGLSSKRSSRARLEKLIEETGLSVPLDVPVSSLPLGVQQKVEILKMLYRDVKVLILDEPTTNLTPIETRELFRVLRRLKERGSAIIFISHKLREVLEVADRITVLRRGAKVGTVAAKQATPQLLARMMVGRDVEISVKRVESKPGRELLAVRDLWVRSDAGTWAVKGVSFTVRAGEIFGIAGVEGNGQKELVEAIAGLRRVERGSVIIDGRDVTNRTPLEVYRAGLAHIPEDRQRYGLVIEMSVAENSILGLHRSPRFLATSQRIRWRKVYSHAEEIIKRFEVQVPSLKAKAKTLSGGNQQRLVVGRELSKSPKVILAVNPTRGLDVAATEYIRNLISGLRAEGAAVLLVSSDLDEVLQLSDRVAVMYKGSFMGVARPEELTEEEIGLMMGGYELEKARQMVGA
ncbi:MAG: ABC transporter ATP-binding protein [Thermoproteota archaeon]